MPAFGRKCLALLLTATVVFSLFGTALAQETPSGPPPATFYDTFGTRFSKAVDALHALKVVAGFTETAFEPYQGVTRAQMAALVTRALGHPVPDRSMASFPDVAASHWAAGPIGLAADLGIIRGYPDGLFRPDEPVLYPQVVTMLLRALNLEQKVVGEYPIGHVLLARELGLLAEVDFGLDKAAPRGDVAIMLHRAIFDIQIGGTGPTLSQFVFKRPGSLVITPNAGALTQGSTKLSVAALDWAGKPLDLSVTWAVTSGSAAINAAGVLNITGDAPVIVTATAGGFGATASYTVIKSLAVEADKASVASGATVQLKAVGKTGTNQDVAVTPDWKVTVGSGTISPSGLLTVQGTSAVTVSATVGSLTVTKTIDVVGSVTISPAVIQVTPNQEVQFTAAVKDGLGKVVNAPVTWKSTGAGVINQQGKFVAGSQAGTITVTSGDATATATVQVIKKIEITPGSGTFKKGDTAQFTAKVLTSDDQVVNVPVTWGTEQSSVGIVSSNGLFFAANSGAALITATYGTVVGQAAVTVAGDATAVELSVTPNGMPANGSSTAVITARLIDGSGNTAAGADNVFFSISSNNLGTLNASTAKVENGYATATLTAGTVSGTYSIIASVPGTNIRSASTSFVTTAPSISHIALEAAPGNISADVNSQTTVTARLIDTSGAPMANNTGLVIFVNLVSTNAATGQLNTSQIQIGVGQSSGSTFFRATATPGTTVITGNSTHSVKSTSITSQVVGGAYQLKIRSGIPTGKADNVSEVPIYVEVQDANGNVRTGDNSVLISMNATDGTNVISTSSQQTTWGVATFKLRTNKSGTYDVNVWAVNSVLQTDSTQATFTPGAAYRVALAVEPSTSIAADGVSKVTLRAKIYDANNNLVNSASTPIEFVRISGSAFTLPAVTTVNASSGEATIQLTASTGVGSDVYEARATSLLSSGQIGVATRITGVPVKLAVQSLTEATIAAGQSTTVRVWVMDALNQLVTGDNGRMVNLIVNGTATVTSPQPTVNGVATFTVSSTKAGGVGLTASATGVTADEVGRVLNVAAGTPDRIVLSATPEAMSADGISTSYISAKLVDKYGNPTTGSFAVNLTLSTNEHITLGSTSVITGGQVLVRAKSTPGTTTVNGSTGAYVVSPITFSTYQPGVPSKVVVDSIEPVTAGNSFNNQRVVRARILDSNGNLVTSLSTGIDLTAMALQIGGSTGTNSTNVSMSNTTGLAAHNILPNGITAGAATVTNGLAQFTITNTKAETVNLTPVVYYKGVALQGVPGSMTTTPGNAAKISVTSSSPVASAASPTNVVLTGSVTDVFGNPVAVAGETISFVASSTLYVGLPTQTSVGTSSGSASITATTKQHPTGGVTTITAISTKYGFTSNLTLSTDLPPDRPSLIVRDNFGGDTFITAGEDGARITVTVSLRNTNQKVYVYVNGALVPLYTAVSTSTVVDTIGVGTNSMIGYIKRADLGGAGIKEIRAVVETPLGMSSLSDAGSLNLVN